MSSREIQVKINGSAGTLRYSDSGVTLEQVSGRVRKRKSSITLSAEEVMRANYRGNAMYVRGIVVEFQDAESLREVRDFFEAMRVRVEEGLRSLAERCERVLSLYAEAADFARKASSDPVGAAFAFPKGRAEDLGVRRFNSEDILRAYVDRLNSAIEDLNSLALEVPDWMEDRAKEAIGKLVDLMISLMSQLYSGSTQTQEAVNAVYSALGVSRSNSTTRGQGSGSSASSS